MTERVRFTLGGRHVEADAGASLLAALWNHGARAVRTSVGGAARGPLCAMGTCFECCVSVDGEPHVRACLTPVREGMTVALQTEAPSAGAAGDHRAAALDAQVVVVGGGPAGLAAAVHAAEAGARTLLVDTNARPGGQRAATAYASGAVAGTARIGDQLAAAIALGAGLLDREKALLHAHLTLAAAGLTRPVVAASCGCALANRPAGVAVQPGPPTARACAAIDQAPTGPTRRLDSSVAHPRVIVVPGSSRSSWGQGAA